MRVVITTWMIGWFFFMLHWGVSNVKENGNPFITMSTVFIIWFIFGLFPVLIIKLGRWLSP